MLQTIKQNDTYTRLGDAISPIDAVASLSAILAPAWDVEREIDPVGEVSIVVFSTTDNPAMPTFILYEKAGEVVVATVRDDKWGSEQRFTSRKLAVPAIVEEVARAKGFQRSSYDLLSHPVQHRVVVEAIDEVLAGR